MSLLSNLTSGDSLVDLLRHGRPLGGERFRGSTDDTLSPEGWAQMRAVAAEESEWDSVFSSPARRCADFARELSQQRGLPLQVTPELGERRFGAWENRRASEIPVAELQRFWSDPEGFTPPGAECFEDLRDRVLAGWSRVQRSGCRSPLIVTHGGVIRIILGHILGIPAAALVRIEVPHACRTRLRVPAGEGSPSLMQHGGPA